MNGTPNNGKMLTAFLDIFPQTVKAYLFLFSVNFYSTFDRAQNGAGSHREHAQDPGRKERHRVLDTRRPTVRHDRGGQCRRAIAVHVLAGPGAHTGQLFRLQRLGRSGVQVAVQLSSTGTG